MTTLTHQEAAMDRMYCLTRHVYDLTRKYYLLGRDELLRTMDIHPGDHVLEVGCGTARNLIKLARIHPDAELFGLDASRQMLETAQLKIDRAHLTDSITLRPELAENLHHAHTFGLEQPFDVIFFSYSLSMIPTWPLALEAALENLPSGRSLYIVDFWDQSALPQWFARLLQSWLRLFGVHHRPELLEHLRDWEKQNRGSLQLKSVARRYAYIAQFIKK